MTAKKAARKASTTRTKSPAQSPEPVVTLVPQPHGGAIRRGGTSKGGTGRPPSELRARLVGVFSNRVGVIRRIADGDPVQKIQFPLRRIVELVECPNCGDELVAKSRKPNQPEIMVEVEASASPSDRIKALDLAAKYGLGVKDEVTIVSPEVKDKMARMVALISSRREWVSTELLDLGGEIFS